MANLLVLVLNDVEQVPKTLEAWKQAGVPGVTVIETVGARRLETCGCPDDVPLMPSVRALVSSGEESNRTLFAVIEDEAVLERAITATQTIIGDLMEPNTGILFVVPVSRTWGVPGNRRAQTARA